MEYEFGLRFKLAKGDANIDELVERLGAAGCDDAAVGIGQPGRVALDFTREAPSARQAIVSALKSVKRAIPRARLIEVTPDLTGLTDVAELVGMTRQNMRKLMLTHAESFPAPVHEGSTALWHLSSVLQWLKSRAGSQIRQPLLDVAHIAMQINLVKEANAVDASIERAVRALVA